MATDLHLPLHVQSIVLTFLILISFPANSHAGVCEWLLSRSKAQPVSTLTELPELSSAQQVQDFIDQHAKRFDLFPQISPDELGSLKRISTSGVINRGMYLSELGGKPVIIKRFSTPERSIGDVAWLYFLNQFDLGAKFYGVLKVEGSWAMVMEVLPGENTKDLGFPAQRKRANVTSKAVQSIRDQLIFLHDLGIAAFDWQFMVSGDDAVLIDTANFRFGSATPYRLNEDLRELEGNILYWKRIGVYKDPEVNQLAR